MAFGSFSSLFIALCSSSDVAVYLTFEFLGFASCLHSLGIHLPRIWTNSFQEKQHQCSRTCYCSNFSNEHYLILFYFHLNQLGNFPAKTYQSGKKRIARPQRQVCLTKTSSKYFPVQTSHLVNKPLLSLNRSKYCENFIS